MPARPAKFYQTWFAIQACRHAWSQQILLELQQGQLDNRDHDSLPNVLPVTSAELCGRSVVGIKCLSHFLDSKVMETLEPGEAAF